MDRKFNCLFIGTILILGGIACNHSAQKADMLANPVQANSELPFLISNGDNLYMSWVHHTDDSGGVTLNYSQYNGNGWSDPETISEGDSWFVNWADFPSITARDGKVIAAHWLDKIPGNAYSYNVNISLAGENNRWSEPLTPHSDNTATEHGFVSMINWEDNRFLAAWLDGRQTADRADDEYYDLTKAMTLRSAVISQDGKTLEKYLIDESVCDCCPTSMVQTPDGALVAYRDRTEEEIRDISVSRFSNGSWTEPQAIHNDNWKISACPVNGPKLATDDSLTVIAWYTGAGDTSRVKAAISNDFGKTFSQPYLINDGLTTGRVDAVVNGQEAYISWIEKEGDQMFIKVRRMNENGKLSKSKTVAAIDGSRRSGFPRMELFQDRLIFAWTDISTSYPAVRTADLSIKTSF